MSQIDHDDPGLPRFLAAAFGLALGVTLAGCRSPQAMREQADRVARANVEEAQRKALGRTEPFQIEKPSDTLRRRLLLDAGLPASDPASLGAADVPRIPQWPDPQYNPQRPGETNAESAPPPLRLTLIESLQIAARNSREYQEQKESVFQTALDLDLERQAFRTTWTGRLQSMFRSDGGDGERASGVENSASLGLERAFETGGQFTLGLGLDLVKLLTQDKSSSLGVLADSTLSIPLLRGSGRFVVTEPLTLAEREVVYAIHGFERFKRAFAVEVASAHLGVLQQLDQTDNARANYERLVKSTRRARRLADAGELPEIQVDQARQDELRARNRWISSQLDYERQADDFKLLLGLPTDAGVEFDRAELQRLAEMAATLIPPAGANSAAEGGAVPSANAPVVLPEPIRRGGGRYELDEREALLLALANRLDLRTRTGRVLDAQRATAVAADQLRADLALLGRAQAGESRTLARSGSENARLNLSDASYSAGLDVDLPLNRTDERNAYRSSLIQFEAAVRDVQAAEDRVKLEVREDLRTLQENRETVAIQQTAVEVARRRLNSTTMFLEAGRAEIRDVLEAEEALVSAQNALTAALVAYRIAELELQRDMDVLEVDSEGVWREYVPPPEKDGSP